MIEILNAAFSGQAVVIPAHGIESVEPAHPFVTHRNICLRVGEHVAHMQRS